MTYSNGFVYENGSLSYILTSVGRYVVNGSSGKYEYNICDHLGNVRAVVDDSGELLQQNDYYPFGGVMSSFGGSDNKYLYNGKELQEGTDWLDYGARMYDGYLGRFFCVDAHAENYLSCTPYNYVGNNPLLFIDPDGMDWYKHSKTGSIAWREGNKKIEGYTNIGASYTENLGGGVSMTYTQQDLTSITFTTLSNSDWETQAYIDANGKERWDGCKKTCDKMLAKVKGKSTRSGEIILTTGDKNGVVNGTTGKLSDGTKSINSSIDNGMPVIVGVDYKDK